MPLRGGRGTPLRNRSGQLVVQDLESLTADRIVAPFADDIGVERFTTERPEVHRASGWPASA